MVIIASDNFTQIIKKDYKSNDEHQNTTKTHLFLFNCRRVNITVNVKMVIKWLNIC